MCMGFQTPDLKLRCVRPAQAQQKVEENGGSRWKRSEAQRNAERHGAVSSFAASGMAVLLRNVLTYRFVYVTLHAAGQSNQ